MPGFSVPKIFLAVLSVMTIENGFSRAVSGSQAIKGKANISKAINSYSDYKGRHPPPSIFTGLFPTLIFYGLIFTLG